eukprot:6598707-Pyramimonas_sp.AAC.1
MAVRVQKRAIDIAWVLYDPPQPRSHKENGVYQEPEGSYTLAAFIPAGVPLPHIPAALFGHKRRHRGT